jgi:hypothetical protein
MTAQPAKPNHGALPDDGTRQLLQWGGSMWARVAGRGAA